MPYVQTPCCVLVFSEVVMMAVVSVRVPVKFTVKSMENSLAAWRGACREQNVLMFLTKLIAEHVV
jgi:hypothetical protein